VQSIEIPVKPVKIDAAAAAKAAAVAFRKESANKFSENYYCKTEPELWYYPYYIGIIKTIYPRLLFGPKIILFYIVCDAIDETYIVLRNIPKTIEIYIHKNKILHDILSEKIFVSKICSEAIDSRINKQFIFGTPDSEYNGSRLIFLPGYISTIHYNNTKANEYFINGYTREIKKLIQRS
jgi:hypothetical protein